jgi:hypothetical protein
MRRFVPHRANGAVQYAKRCGFPRIAGTCRLLEQFMLEVPGRQFAALRCVT